MQIIENKALLLNLRNPAEVLAHIPRSRVVAEYPQGKSVLVHWGMQEVQVLRNLGIRNTPSPILRNYPFPGLFTPFAHQRVTSAFLTLNRRAYILSEQGTGKSASVAWAADYLMVRRLVRRILIICPLSVMGAVWQADLFKTLMHRTVDIAHGTREKRIKVIQSDAEIVIINYDGVERVQKELAAANFDLVILDEANAIKTATTRRWKSINNLIRPDTWLWMMTGTPASQAPSDAYGLARMMHPDKTNMSFTRFKDSVMVKMTQFLWVPRVDAVEKVNAILQPAIRFTKAECLDLPEIIYTYRDVPLTPMQKKYYAQVKEQRTMQAAGVTVTAINAAALVTKLLQISAGAVYTDDRDVVEFDISERLNVLKEVIDDSTHKVLVFVPYRHTITVLEERLKASGYTVDVIHGGVSANNRTEIIKRFQTEKDPHVLIIQPAAASHGITLHAANTVVWWSPHASNEVYHQANARVHRAGQKNPCLVVRLRGSSVEGKRYQSLEKKTSDMHDLLDLYHSEFD